jgi:hypothetical protein
MTARKRRTATVDDLLGKPKRTEEMVFGDLRLKFQAVSSKTYDDLVAAHPPLEGDTESAWNGDTFAPALLAASSLEPKLSVEQATQVWESDAWSRGELMDMFSRVVKLNVAGLDTPFGNDG